jgi:hypothetical protein
MDNDDIIQIPSVLSASQIEVFISTNAITLTNNFEKQTYHYFASCWQLFLLYFL